MYIAELKGKLSPGTEKMEDVLTSDVFSFFKYAERRFFLKSYFERLGLNISEDDAKGATFDFWPRYEDNTEPDLVITAGHYYILFEAKYFSDFGEETNKTKAQLVREVNNGIVEAKKRGYAFVLFAITADSYLKEDRLYTLPKELVQYCKWTNWQSVAECLRMAVEREKGIQMEDRLFASDLYDLLDKKHLRGYHGIVDLFQGTGRQRAAEKVFFDARTAKFRGDFIGFNISLSLRTKPLSSFKYIFLDRRRRLFQHSNYPANRSRNKVVTIFFRR